MSRSERYAALLRGINVGRAKRVAMGDLRTLMTELGFTDVRTLLNSGNVAFSVKRKGSDTAAMQEKIELEIASNLGVSCRVTVLSGAELDNIIAANPFPEGRVEPSRFLIAILRRAADGDRLADLVKRQWTPDALALHGRAAYLWCASGILESDLFEAVGRALGDQVTTRNWATMTKLQALLAAGEGLGNPTRTG